MLTILGLSAFANSFAQSTNDEDTLFVYTKKYQDPALYELNELNKITFSTKGVQFWNTDWPTEYPYTNVSVLSFKKRATLPKHLRGDVNSDGTVDISDVTALVNLILSSSNSNPYGDVSGDGDVNISDVTELVNIILGKTFKKSPQKPRKEPSEGNRQATAHQYLNFYQDKVVLKQISTEEIDSMSVTETEPRTINLWHNGEVFLSYLSVDIDSITVTNQGGYPLSYIGIVGFNDQLYPKGIGILSTYTASQYKSFVNNMPSKYGTLLYYAVDNALDMLDNANIPTPLKNATLITFTDGLDQGSLMMTDQYGSSVDYLTAMSRRIAQTKVRDLPVTAYTVGLRGKDVSNESLFQQNLQRLATSPNNVYELSNISGLRSKLQEIASQIICVSNRQTMSAKIPGIDNGTLVRFVFDGKPAASSELYIEGTFNLQDRSLHDVTYHGLKATTGSLVQGTQTGIFVTYTFTGMRPLSGNGLIPTSSVKHYYRMPSSTSWQINSEFSPEGNTQRSVSHSGASIFLILDCSKSLGSDFSKMQQYANEFIDLVAGNAEPFNVVAPTNVSAALAETDLVINVSWNAVNYAQSYNIYRSSSSSGTYSLVAENVTTPNWTDESPLSGYNYYKVCATGFGYTSSQSSYASVNVTLNAPTNVTAGLDVKNNNLVINVSWDAVPFAQSYQIYRSSSSSGTYSLVAENITSTDWTDESPLSGSNYYKICAVNRNVISSRSSYTYLYYNLSAPANVVAGLDVQNDNLVVKVSWDAVQYAQSYNVYRSSSSSGTYALVAENVTSNSWTDDSSLSGNYYYKVCAVGYGFTSSQSSYASVNVKLSVPTNVWVIVAEDDLVINLFWGAIQHAQSYQIYRSGYSSGAYTLVAENVTSTNWTDDSPLSGYNYYKVCAKGYGFTSSLSSYASARISLDAPTNVVAGSDVKNNNWVVNVSWGAVQYAQSYKVYRSSSSNGTYEFVAANVTSTSWTDDSPLGGNNYYKVCAVNRNTSSSQSSSSNVVSILGCPNDNHPHVIDLGLPSGTKWYCCNMGASSPEGYGGYYAWGETSTKDYYHWSTYKWGSAYNQLTKYNTKSSYGSVVDNKTTLDFADDAATANRDATWCMPSSTQIRELLNKCSHKWTQQNGVNGRLFTGPNGNSVFLPAAGRRSYGELYGEGSHGYYWSSSLDESEPNIACCLDLRSGDAGLYHSIDESRYYGFTVRPVVHNLKAPTNVVAGLDIQNDNLVVKVSWDAVHYAQSYKVYRSSSSSGTYSLVAENVTTTNWTDESPLSGNNYYRVCAVNRNITSSQSSYVYLNFNLCTPTNVMAEQAEDDLVINLSWDAIQHAQSYQIYRSSSSSGTYELVAENVTSNQWTDESPLSGSNYYKVCATAYGFTSAQSSYTSANVSLNAPANVVAGLDIKNNNLVINLSWDAVPFAQSYQIYRSSSSSGTYMLVAENVTSTNWTDESPLSGSNYYKVCAVNRNVKSSQSSYAYRNYNLSAPVNVIAGSDVKNNNWVINVSWGAVQYAQSYKVYRSSSSNGTYEFVAANVTSTSWTDDSPLSGRNYYKVCAVGYGFTSEWSEISILVFIGGICPDNNHPHVIDLGLPSGTLWSCCNVGASKPEDYGGYYAWGETSTKDYYAWSTYKWGSAYNQLTKYNTKSSYGSVVDNKTTLDSADDAATANWGASWCMPSEEQMKELVNNCSYQWAQQNGVKGGLFTGSNGNSVFLPAAGYRWNSSLDDRGGCGYYWSGTLNPRDSYNAYGLGFDSGYSGWNNWYTRHPGRSVRPVSK